MSYTISHWKRALWHGITHPVAPHHGTYPLFRIHSRPAHAYLQGMRSAKHRVPPYVFSVRSHSQRTCGGDPVTFTWKGNKLPDGHKTVTAREGQTLLEVSREHDIGLEAACEGSLACSTCHCILDARAYATAPVPCEAEEDLLDLAFDLRPTSRLGCQVKVTKDMEGTVVEIPSATRNMAVDGYTPDPH